MVWFVANLTCGALLCVACYTDTTRRIIPNGLTLPMLCCGLLYGWFRMPGLEGLAFACKGGMIGGALLLLPYTKGWTGGGDLKLLAALGSWIGLFAVISVFCYGTIVGGFMAGIHLLRHRRAGSLKKGTNNKTAAGIPYAWAIGGGYLIYQFYGNMLP